MDDGDVRRNRIARFPLPPGTWSPGPRETGRRIADLVAQEDRTSPLCDARIAEQLRAEGFSIERRTVTKTRKQLGIASSRQRSAV